MTHAYAVLSVGNLDSVTDTSDGDTGLFATGGGGLLIKHDANNFLQLNSGFVIKASTFDLDATTLVMDSANGGLFKLGSSPSLTANGIFLSGSGEFNLLTDSSNFIRQSGGTFSLQSQNATISGSSVNIGAEDFDLQASTLRLQSAAGGKLALGGTLPTNLSSNGIFLSGSGEFNIQKDSDEYFRFTTTNG